MTKLLLQVSKHPTHRMNLCREVFIATNTPLHLCQFDGNLYLDMFHGTNKKQSFTPHPHEASLAKVKSVHNNIDSDQDIQWHHAPNRGNHREEDRNSLASRLRRPS
jgi:hypothetical protein